MSSDQLPAAAGGGTAAALQAPFNPQATRAQPTKSVRLMELPSQPSPRAQHARDARLGGGAQSGSKPEVGELRHQPSARYKAIVVVRHDYDVPWYRRAAQWCGRLRQVQAREWLARHITFFYLHLIYFLLLALIGGAIIYGIERGNVAYIDSLYFAASASCVTGLSTVDFSTLRVGSQIIVLILIMLGSTVLMSAVPVLIRRRYFTLRVESEVEDPDERARILKEDTTEYRALTWVARIAVTYFLVCQLVGFLVWGMYLQWSSRAHNIVRAAGLNPWWWALFHSVSAFNNAGFGLFSDSLFRFADDYAIILVAAALIMLGNVLYPPAFRFIVWVLHKARPRDEALAFLLANPRRCFTHMFGRKQTWILLASNLGFYMFEFVMFLALDYDLPAVAQYPGRIRALMAFFQASSTRTAGFQVLDISLTAPGMQVLYALFMYVAAYPFILSIRRTTVDAKKKDKRDSPLESEWLKDDSSSTGSAGSLTTLHIAGATSGRLSLPGAAPQLTQRLPTKYATPVSATPPLVGTLGRLGSSVRSELDSVRRSMSYMDRGLEAAMPPPQPDSGASLRTHMRNVMSRDLLWLFFALFIMCICESNKIRTTPYPQNMSIFGILFELSSAYGTVGLTLGYPGTAPSLSGQFTILSKLIIIVTMLGGRHRGLPFSIDSAVYLPSLLNKKVAPQEVPDASLATVAHAITSTIGRATAGSALRSHRSMRSLQSIFAPPAAEILPEASDATRGRPALEVVAVDLEEGVVEGDMIGGKFLASLKTPQRPSSASSSPGGIGAPHASSSGSARSPPSLPHGDTAVGGEYFPRRDKIATLTRVVEEVAGEEASPAIVATDADNKLPIGTRLDFDAVNNATTGAPQQAPASAQVPASADAAAATLNATAASASDSVGSTTTAPPPLPAAK